ACWLPGVRGQFVVHGLVPPDAVRHRDQNPLQHAMLPGQGPGRDACLTALQQRRPGLDLWSCGLAPQGRGRKLHPWVAAQAPGLPCLVVGAEERAAVTEGDAHRGADPVPSRLQVVSRIVLTFPADAKSLLTASPFVAVAR